MTPRLALLSAGAVSRLPVLRGLLFRPRCSLRRSLSYQQGQSPEPLTRHYFYYIDHQGQVRRAARGRDRFTSLTAPDQTQVRIVQTRVSSGKARVYCVVTQVLTQD
uniref:Uncharacterized protein n=1 Tax=Leptobrachium leishanense TaxID=445787 RepID=A0A8C5PV02_9ANUR